MADPKLDDLLASHRRFAPRLSEDRLIQVIKERRAELAVPSNVRPEWKESILEIYVTEAQDRGMYVGNPYTPGQYSAAPASAWSRLFSKKGGADKGASTIEQAKVSLRRKPTRELFKLWEDYNNKPKAARSKQWGKLLEAEIRRRGLGPQMKHYVPTGALASYLPSPEENPRKKKAAKRKTKKKTAKKKAAKRKTKKKSSKKKSAKKKTLGTRVRTAAKKGERAAKRGAKRAKKFAGTEEGYMTGGAMTGALLAGPIGAGLGLVAGKKLYEENPDGRRMVSGRVPRSMSKTVRKRNANKHALEARAHIAHWQERQDPRSLIQALRSTALAEQEYRHAGVMGSDRVFGADPAAAQYDELRAQIMEILA